MRHGKRPTLQQKIKLKELNLNCDNWLVVTDNKDEMVIVHKNTGNTRIIKK